MAVGLAGFLSHGVTVTGGPVGRGENGKGRGNGFPLPLSLLMRPQGSVDLALDFLGGRNQQVLERVGQQAFDGGSGRDELALLRGAQVFGIDHALLVGEGHLGLMVHCTRVVLCSCSHTSVMEPVTIYVGLAARACSSVEAKETCTPWRPSSSASERLNQSAMVELAVNTERPCVPRCTGGPFVIEHDYGDAGRTGQGEDGARIRVINEAYVVARAAGGEERQCDQRQCKRDNATDQYGHE